MECALYFLQKFLKWKSVCPDNCEKRHSGEKVHASQCMITTLELQVLLQLLQCYLHISSFWTPYWGVKMSHCCEHSKLWTYNDTSFLRCKAMLFLLRIKFGLIPCEIHPSVCDVTSCIEWLKQRFIDISAQLYLNVTATLLRACNSYKNLDMFVR